MLNPIGPNTWGYGLVHEWLDGGEIAIEQLLGDDIEVILRLPRLLGENPDEIESIIWPLVRDFRGVRHRKLREDIGHRAVMPDHES